MYIVIEGIDGSGKSTHAMRLAEDLGAQLVREPSGEPIGRLIRKRINEGRVNAAVMARLFAADRHDLAERVIRPALERGEIVVSDRNLVSSLVYQSEGDLTPDAVWDLNMKGAPLPTPDLVVVIEVSVGEAARRLKESRGHTDAFETAERLKLHHARYKKLQQFVRWPVVYVDGEAEREVVAGRVKQAVAAVLAR